MEYSNMGVARGRLNDLDYFAQKIQEAVDDMLGIESKAKKAEPEKPAQETAQQIFTTQTQPATFGKTEPAIQGTIVPGTSLADKLAWLQRSADSHNTYIVEVNADESISPHTFEYKGAINVTVVLRGVERNRTIRLKSHGAMFIVRQNITFVLDNNITIHGHKGNTAALVDVYGGTFEMNNGATITGNSRCGVYVAENGIFNMNGGIISNNTDQYGGGVRVFSGTFDMNGGTISSNTAFINGGGVDEAFGTFRMNGGFISGNRAGGDGGGIAINCGQTFNMRNGTITANTAGISGGGVWINGCGSTIFTKTGGTITSYTSDKNNGNVVRDDSGALARRGHTIYVNENKRKETTAGPGVNMNSKENGAKGGWDE